MISTCRGFLLLFLSLRLSASFLLQPNTKSFPHHTGRCRDLQAAEESIDADHDIVLQLPLLEAEYATTDDRERRSELEEAISNAKTAAEFGIRRAQVEFYSAFSEQDMDAMKSVWSTGDDVRCVHPGMQAINGHNDIMVSWQQVFLAPAFTIEPERVSIEICGRTALCSCIEGTPGGGKLEALNVYRREGGSWKMTLHMASPIIVNIP